MIKKTLTTLALLLTLLHPTLAAELFETIHLEFKHPELINTASGPKLTIPEINTSLYIQGQPALPIKQIIRRFDDDTFVSINTHSNRTATPTVLKYDTIFKGNPGYRLLKNGTLAPVPLSNLNQTPFPRDPVTVQYFHGIDSQSMQHVNWLIISIYPVQIIAPETAVFYETFDIDLIETRLSGKNISRANNRAETLCIISPDHFLDQAQTLADHKNQAGVIASCVALSTTLTQGQGRDEPEKLRDFIRQRFEQMGTLFFLLLGDSDQIPVRYCSQQEDPLNIEQIPSDIYYSDIYGLNASDITWDHDNDNRFGEYPDDMDQMDFAPDLFVQRIPVSTTEEVETAIAKITSYETLTSHDADWFNTMMFVAVDTFNAEAHGETTGIPEGELYAEQLEAEFFSSDTVIKLYETETYPRDAEALPDAVPEYSQNGIGTLAFHCHGAPDCLQLADYLCFTHQNTEAMHNGTNLPFTYGFACSTAAFDNELPDYPYSTGDESMPEHFLLNPQGGAISYIGATRVAVAHGSGFSDQRLSGSGALEYRYWDAWNSDNLTAGTLFARAQIEFLKHIGINGYYNIMTYLEHCSFGDPSLAAGGYRQEPSFNLVSSTVVNSDTGDSCVAHGDTASVALSLLCQGRAVSNPLFQLETSHSGITILNDTFTVESLSRFQTVMNEEILFRVDESAEINCPAAFTLKIYETSQLIWEETFELFVGEQANLVLDNLSWSYESNTNGHLDPGETVFLTLYGHNSGCAAMTEPVTTMNVDSPWVTAFATNEVNDVNSVRPGWAYISPYYRISMTISDQCPHGIIIPVDVTVTDGETNRAWSRQFMLQVEDFRGPAMQNYQLSNRLPEPGEVMDFHLEASDVSGISSVVLEIASQDDNDAVSINMEQTSPGLYTCQWLVPEISHNYIVNAIATDARNNVQIESECMAFSSLSLDFSETLIVDYNTSESIDDLLTVLQEQGRLPGHWSVRFRGKPGLEQINSLDPACVIYLFGYSGQFGADNRIDEATRTVISSLLEQGAGIALSGWDIMRNTWRNGGREWLIDEFGLEVSGGDIGVHKVSGGEDSNLYSQATIRLKKRHGDTNLTGDIINPVASGVSQLEFVDASEPGSGCVSRMDTGIRTLAFPFALEDAKTLAELETLLDPIVPFLQNHPDSPQLLLELNSEEYSAGDPFNLTATLLNPYPQTMPGNVFIALEVNGEFWFWPSWSRYSETGIDSRQVSVAPFENWQERILEFTWPDIPRINYSSRFWGAALDMNQELLDLLQMVEFKY